MDKSVVSVEIIGSTDVKIGKMMQLQANIIPSFAENKNVYWSKSNDNVNITSDGLKCIVEGVSVGTTTITVTTEEGEKTSSVEITVLEQQNKDNYLDDVAWESGAINNSGQLTTSSVDYRTASFNLEEGCYLFSSDNLWKKCFKFDTDNKYICQDIYDAKGNTDSLYIRINKGHNVRLVVNQAPLNAKLVRVDASNSVTKRFSGSDLGKVVFNDGEYLRIETKCESITSLDTFRGMSYNDSNVFTGVYLMYEGMLYFNIFMHKSIATDLESAKAYFDANNLDITFFYE